MWGANCADYLGEVYRVLGNGGILYIAEPTKRWTSEERKTAEEEGLEYAGKLRQLLIRYGFIITDEVVDKFCLFRCMKQKKYR